MRRAQVSARLRKYIFERANGRCEYCLIPQIAALWSHEVDNIVARKHRGVTNTDNLAVSCEQCNLNKGSDIASIDPETNLLTRLFNPRLDRWAEHFSLQGARIEPLTTVGRATERLLQFNTEHRLGERKWLIEAGVFEPLAEQESE